MMRQLLQPLTPLYRGVVQTRNWCYDHQVLRSHRVSVPVVSVGNLSVGGSGKTPLVEYLSTGFQQAGKKVGIISRGYKRKSSGQIIVCEGDGPVSTPERAGDEPYMLSLLHPEWIIVVDEDRAEAAETAVREYAVDVLLMDDGFQHRKLARDVDVVVIPVSHTSDHMRLLPSGDLREPWSSLSRATHIVLRGDVGENLWEKAEQWIADFSNATLYRGVKRTVPVLRSRFQDSEKPFEDFDLPPSVFAVTGIGDPGSFQDALRASGCSLSGFQAFPDHYSYSPESQHHILTEFHQSGADMLVMTAKDIVKWDEAVLKENPVYYLPVEFTLEPDLVRDILNALP